MPIVLRCAVAGAGLLGVLGLVVGTIIGLHVYAPTAWAAAFEIGIPSAVLGALLGSLAGLVSLLIAGKPRRHTT
ncbi:hypothetical protein GCM10022242_28450 [Nocardioides panacisoli]|uniref:Major facilitator superfamily (MFS) profile domain-containing protein n=2 Tax=Nocardioides panacisoli TaxID=627624 RepID=A0ABP7ISS0_9ACTN